MEEQRLVVFATPIWSAHWQDENHNAMQTPAVNG